MKPNSFDIIIVGGGHSGLEASLISEKLKKSVALITMDPNAIARMSCNPAIGGLAKGQIVRELDVLGGVMGRITDVAGIQFKTLNKRKGRAVWSPRAQVDKREYEALARQALKTSEVSIIQGEVVSLIISKNTIGGVILRDERKIYCSAVIITTGTFMSGTIHIGERKIKAGRMGEERSEGLTEYLNSVGFRSEKLKTGTPPRIHKDSIDWTKTNVASGDREPFPFSYFTKNFSPRSVPCHTINTNSMAHDIIKDNKRKSPMFSGDIGGMGPRYCPSIEDKVHRFQERNSHVLFLEPEWIGSDQVYLNGFSTSLPEEVQSESLKMIPGFERVSFLRPGYAIEYDYFPTSQLKSSLETKDVAGLYFAGQINGTSGYEEAAGQGLLAGINASNYVCGKRPLVLSRSSSYIGVMIDDLITKDTNEPYRMFTSRAEYRLLLRITNTCDRLVEFSKSWSLLSDLEIELLSQISDGKNQLRSKIKKSIRPEELKRKNLIKQPAPGETVLKANNVSIKDFPNKITKLKNNLPSWLNREILLDIESSIKYKGYIKRHKSDIENIKKNERLTIPKNTKYKTIPGLSHEAAEKMSSIRPENLGQASRISGVNPVDISIINIFLKSGRVSRETK